LRTWIWNPRKRIHKPLDHPHLFRRKIPRLQSASPLFTCDNYLIIRILDIIPSIFILLLFRKRNARYSR
jgi:hypothetical protein